MPAWVIGRPLIKQDLDLKRPTFGSYLGPRLELGVVVGVEGGVARQREEPSQFSPPLRTSSMICSHVSGRLVGFVVT